MSYIRVQRADRKGNEKHLYIDLLTPDRISEDFFTRHPEVWAKLIRVTEGILHEALLIHENEDS